MRRFDFTFNWNLMEKRGWSVEHAMEGLKIPEKENSKYLDE